MLTILQIITSETVALAMAMAVAHALEMPGKMRLQQSEYFTVQHIYYPGFTIGGGIGEAGGVILTLVLLFVTPARSLAFWLTLVALVLLLSMQGVYWLSIHRVNTYWLQDQQLSKAGSSFFGLQTKAPEPGNRGLESWEQLRNRWEYAHLARAILAFLGFLSLLIALATSRFGR